MSKLSFFELRHDLPAHHRRWVRAAFLVAAAAYLGVNTIRLALGQPLEVQELVMLGVCITAFAFEPRYPQTAATAVLLGVWTEMMVSYAITPEGLHGPSSVALPLLVMSAALLLGAPSAWFLALATSVALPSALILGRAYFGGPGIAAQDLPFLLVLEVTLLGAATLLTLFLHTLTTLVRRESETTNRMREFVEMAPDAIIVSDESGKVVVFNSLAEEYLKVRRSEALGRPIEYLRSRYPACFPRDAGTTSTRPAYLHILNRSLEVRARQQRVGERMVDWIFVLRDLSEREEAERNNAALRSQLNHIQKMDAIGQLAGGVAHDFNNLLTAVSGAAYALQDSDPQETSEIAQELREATEQGAALTRQLLTFARREVVQARVLSLDQVLESSRTLLARLLGERIRLVIDAQPDCTVRIDEGQLKQVLFNFAANARDAIDGSGEFILRCRCDGDWVELSAEDTGCGMSKQTVDHIFEPFFTTKSSNQGTGLGLATTFGIVRQWEGTIEVNSELGQGTRFSITWPFTDAEPTGVVRSRAPSRRYHAAGSILLVEDNDSARRFMRRILDRAGYHVTEAMDGLEALQIVERGYRPDLLISDVMMPSLSGVELAKRLHARLPQLPVLFVSGYVDDVLSDWPYDTARDLLLKPFTAEALLSRLQKKMDHRESA